MDDAPLGSWFGSQHDPVAHHGKIRQRGRRVAKTTAGLRPPLKSSRDAAQPALFLDHARYTTGRRLGRHLRLKEITPAKTFEYRHDGTPSSQKTRCMVWERKRSATGGLGDQLRQADLSPTRSIATLMWTGPPFSRRFYNAF